MINKLLSQFGSGSKEFVGVSLNAGGLLEVAVTSHSSSTLVKYTNRNVPYNAIARKIEDYDAFRTELESALNELQLNPKGCNITLSLPNVVFGIKSLPEHLSDEEIKTAIESSVDDSYIFKRELACISWTKLKNDPFSANDEGLQKIAYSAIQESAVDALKDRISAMGANLISIQNSFSTLFEGLNFSHLVEEKILTSGTATPWNAILISSTSYSIFNFIGTDLNDYFEEPLAIKSYGSGEVYAAVSSMASIYLQNFQADNLLVISDADDISAGVIAEQLGFVGPYVSIEQNKFQQSPIISADFNILPSFHPQISICSIGSSVDQYESTFFKFNYLSSEANLGIDTGDLINIGGKTVEINTTKAYILSGILAIIFLAVFGGLGFLLNNINKEKDTQLTKLAEEEQTLETQRSGMSNKAPTVNINTTIDSITKANRKKMLYYDALSYGIPEKVWVEFFHVLPNNGVNINGVSPDSSDIGLFLKGIREVSGETGISVTKLTITGDDGLTVGSGSELYSFSLASPNYGKVDMGTPAENSSAANQKDGAQPAQTNPEEMMPQQPQGSDIPPAEGPSVPPPVLPAD